MRRIRSILRLPGGRLSNRRLLFRAQLLLRSGEFGAAAGLFEELAQSASALEPERMPALLVQAGRARVLNGQVERGVGLIERGLALLQGDGRTAELSSLGRVTVEGLRQSGFFQQAEDVAGWLDTHLTGQVMTEPPAAEYGVQLPLECPSCGAPLAPQEVVWVDAKTAVCLYCGSLVRGQEAQS